MKFSFRFIILIFLFFLSPNSLTASENVAYLDLDFIVQNSNIGKKILNDISNLNKKNINNLEKKNKILLELEKNIKNKKNIISDEDFNKDVKNFQQKVNIFKEEKNKIVENFNDFRSVELEKLFKSFNPLITKYMEENSIGLLIDSKNVFMGNPNLNITRDILEIINKELK